MKDSKDRLSRLGVGEECTVTGFDTTAEDKRQRLMDLGLIKGARVTCIGKSPFGNPKAYLIRGAIIAIRNFDAGAVRVVIESRGS